ncbi:MAG: DEAD/DEAH box helicase, partial [Candidatus Lokiarchaeota archaeon]|nr:DEAD/DEAH box helicase [Candidatus Lokiarchaeota archaeon]
MKFTDLEPVKKEEKLDEIFQYISDERILRVLLELKIFKLREIQKEAIKKGVFFQKSFLVCAPSGSGKTLIGEICAVINIFQKFGKSIYLVPYKALATEKYVHFKKSYERFGVKVELSIGDYDVEDARLEQADILVTTYEKMDSILRNFSDKEWIFAISTIIIDEIHILGDASGSRGPRLESLIVRLNEFLHNPQIIGLSATIANPRFFNDWLSSLGNKTTLIMSDVRPVPLQYRIEITQNKDSTIKKI